MTVPGSGNTNAASGEANVGVQAGFVQELTVYPRGDLPEDDFRTGQNYLAGGTASEARRFIGAAMHRGYATSKVSFHWLLALLSDRSLRQLSDEDRSSLHAARQQSLTDDDEWSRGLKVINRLLDSVETPETNPKLVFKEVDALGTEQKDKIYRHLGMFIKGPIKDLIWHHALERIDVEQMSDHREKRVWKFFEPTPINPRVRPPDPLAITKADRFWLFVATAFFALATGYVGWLLLDDGKTLALLAYPISITAGYVCFVSGLEWLHRTERWEAKDKIYWPQMPRGRPAPEAGFARSVDDLFSHYFERYIPDSADRATWLADTAGIRKYLRDEVVERYREARVGADRIAWLIRHQVSQVKQHWQANTLFDYQEQWRMHTDTKSIFLLSLFMVVAGCVCVIGGAIQADPRHAIIAVAAMAASGWGAVQWRLRMMLEQRRFTAEQEEEQQRRIAADLAFNKWLKKLANKPSDVEMATWLYYDRKLLMNQVMQHYKLKPSDVIAHAFIDAPGKSCKQARDRYGPWRYSKYELLVFLLTTDGVRQVTADLDFEKGTLNLTQRLNYRFDAVAAVQITNKRGQRQTFELTLVNGQPIRVSVTESSTDQPQEEANPEGSKELSDLTLDASGFNHALHVLEGVAADGKEWIRYEDQRQSQS